jgi:trehalose/maltose hydrolase-like predicted phosphorylase
MNDWTWTYHGYEPERERLRESLCTLGNGYFATRGAAPECPAGPVHYPGTYVAGCYNRLASTVGGRRVENEDMVNLPNWLPLRVRVRGRREWLFPDLPELDSYELSLDLRAATLTRRLSYALAPGQELTIHQVRVVHMGDPHLALLRTEVTARGWSGEVEVESALDGDVTNSGVRRYADLSGRHLTGYRTGAVEPDLVWLKCRTSASDIGVSLAARIRVSGPGEPVVRQSLEPMRAAHLVTVPVADGVPVTVDKTAALHTSRDPAIGDPTRAAIDRVRRAPGFERSLASHRTAWDTLWRNAELEVPNKAGETLRLHLFHVLQTLSPHTAELDVGVPARGLHGEAYRGHVFWDELFVLPFLNLHFPEVSRALLAYRHRRLPAARRAAADAGLPGAMFPWQSASDGHEETQTLHLNPRSGHWLPDHSHLQHHVGSAIAYNIWQYCQASDDSEFLHTKGAETLLEIARFWAGKAALDPVLGRYRIRGVVGPDEYHDAYPEAESPGLDDNAYTNVTAAWVLGRALDLVRGMPVPRLRELRERTGLDDEELWHWEEVSRRLLVPFHAGVISQFDGYGELAELDWNGYRTCYGDIRRLDRILESEGDTVNRYQASKQADVLMLGYLFSPAELAALFEQLGYEWTEETWRSTVEYYLRRTTHGSTLSGLVHAWVLARARRADAWTYFQEALAGDVADLQGGTTGEGIHLGAMAGTLDLVQRGLTGLETREDALWLDPAPLPELKEYSCALRYRGHWGIRVRVCADRVEIGVPDSSERPIMVVGGEHSAEVAPGERTTLDFPGP